MWIPGGLVVRIRLSLPWSGFPNPPDWVELRFPWAMWRGLKNKNTYKQPSCFQGCFSVPDFLLIKQNYYFISLQHLTFLSFIIYWTLSVHYYLIFFHLFNFILLFHADSAHHSSAYSFPAAIQKTAPSAPESLFPRSCDRNK